MWKIFGPRNSLVLLWDHLTQEGADDLERQIDEISRYYQFVPFSHLVRPEASGRRLGSAAIAFKNPRKSFFLRALSLLKEKQVVPILFLRPELIGTNRIPLEDEWAAYPAEQTKPMDIGRLTWENVSEANRMVNRIRETSGPLPLDNMDPGLFMGTWGNIVETLPSRCEIGLHVPSRPKDSNEVRRELEFAAKQLTRQITTAFIPHEAADTLEVLRGAGITSVLTSRQGIVEKKTSPFGIPHYIPKPI